MDSTERSQICPWCQTEIVWDPEFGPEDTCPHCLNELGGYRSLKLKINQEDGELSLEEPDRHEHNHSGHTHHHHQHDEDDDDELEVDDLLDDYTVDPLPDDYAERVIAVMDQQEYAPECPNCHELMLHAGVRVVGGSDFKPVSPAPLGMPFLSDPYAVDVFVCPSCFKTDEYLTKQTKEDMMQIFVPGNKD